MDEEIEVDRVNNLLNFLDPNPIYKLICHSIFTMMFALS